MYICSLQVADRLYMTSDVGEVRAAALDAQALRAHVHMHTHANAHACQRACTYTHTRTYAHARVHRYERRSTRRRCTRLKPTRPPPILGKGATSHIR